MEFWQRALWVVSPTVLRFKPSVPVEFGAMATHHILSDKLEDMPKYSPLVFPMMDFVIGQHRLRRGLLSDSSRSERICTLAMARQSQP